MGYGSCQMRWFLKRLEEAPPDRPDGLQLVLGTAFDAAAAAALTAKIEGDVLGIDDGIGIAMDAWDQEIATDRYDTSDGANLPGQLPGVVREYLGEIVPLLDPIAVQHRVEIPLLEVPWRLSGKIDLINRLPDGTEEVDDQKATAGSTKYDPDEDLQLGIYVVARTMELTGSTMTEPGEESPVSRQGFHVARCQKTQHRVEISTEPTSAEKRQRSVDVMVGVAENIEEACDAMRFLPTARLARTWRCSAKFCEFYPKTCAYGARGRKAPAT
jgi:hypothetical protein